VSKLLVKEGDAVAEGQHLVIIEAMKMEVSISAPQAGMVKTINVKEGMKVKSGELLATLGQ
jgi:biotin carboxyl carrier protein